MRDLGGLIVIDFIDMESQKNQRAVEDRLRDAVKQDRARIQIGRISRFGLLELSRQRLRPSIGESASIACPRCSGMGTIRSVDSLALALLRLIGEEARKDRTVKVIAQLPVEVATYLMNEKREWLNGIESKSGAQVVLVPNKYMDTPAYEIRRVRDDESGLPENSAISHHIPVAPPTAVSEAIKEDRPAPPAPLVVAASIATIPPPPTIAMETTIAPAKPAEPVEQIGIFVRAWRFFFGGAGTASKPVAPAAPREPTKPSHEGRRDRPESRHGRDRDRDRDRHGRHGRDRDRGRHEHRDKDKIASGDGRRDGQRHERKPREHSDGARPEGAPRGGPGQHRDRGQQQPSQPPQQSSQPQQQQPPAAPKPEGAPPQAAEPARNEHAERGDRGDRGDRGERRGRRGRRRGRGRGRGGEGGPETGAPDSEQRPEQPGDNARPEAQHSFDLGAPRAEHAAEPAPPKQERSEPAGDPGNSDSKNYTVWSGGPTPSSGSWGGPGSRRDE